MPDSFSRALAVVLKFEGGWSKDPQDAGGATMRGVTQRTYDAWRQRHGQPVQSVRRISDSELQSIYRGDYWDPVQADALPYPLALAVFDLAVNGGVSRAVHLLQRTLGVIEDGQFGPITLAAALKGDPKTTALRLCEARENWYHQIVHHSPSQGKFLTGWLRRVETLKVEIRKG